MPDFDPEKFEDKYVHYFNELQRAYKDAFEYMNERYDSTLVHAIDQRVLSESEPFYLDGTFTIEVPNDAYDRIRDDVIIEHERFEHVLETYRDRIRHELLSVFDLDGPQE